MLLATHAAFKSSRDALPAFAVLVDASAFSEELTDPPSTAVAGTEVGSGVDSVGSLGKETGDSAPSDTL